MTTKFATGIVDVKDSFEAGKQIAKQAQKKIGDSPISLALLFCSTQHDYSSLIRGLQTVIGEDVPIIGCTTAGQFTEMGMNREGSACALISTQNHRFFTGISALLKNNPTEAIQNATVAFPKQVEGYPHHSAILFVDGLAAKGEEAVLAASNVLGPQIKFAGAAAADNLTFSETRVFCNQEDLFDALSICFIASRSPIVISVNHGHHPISPPLKVTKAKENILYELDGRPALEVWKEILQEPLKAQGIDLEALNLRDWSKIFLRYEAGILTGSQEYKIRFPISCNENGSLNFVCPLIEGSVIRIMDSDQKNQIESTKKAVEKALKSAPKGTKFAGAVMFDCVCRTMITKDHFSKAIQECKHVLGSIPFIGCEAYGEIAMEAGQLSGFHNATTVIMLIPS